MIDNMNTCVTCKWFKREDGGFNHECHRYPPIVVSAGLTRDGKGVAIQAHYPGINEGDWCGEHSGNTQLVSVLHREYVNNKS
jgi:hypothetical protein